MQPGFETSSSLKINPDDGSQTGDHELSPKNMVLGLVWNDV